MKILYLCPSPYLGIRDRAGWSTHIAGVIRALRERGHQVRPFLAADPNLRAPLPSAPRDCRRQRLRRIVPGAVRLARRDLSELLHDRWLDHRVLQACLAFGADVIYERTEIYHGVGARVARRLGIPLVVEVNGPLVEERQSWGGLLWPGLASRIERTKYDAADAIVTVSAALADSLAAQGVDRTKIQPVPNAADVTLFHPQRAHPAAILRALGVGSRVQGVGSDGSDPIPYTLAPTPPLVVGFVGAFADWHGLETLVSAMGELACSRVLDLHLLMVGDGPARPALRSLADRVGLSGRVSMPGSVAHDQVPHYLAAMDVCVLPQANWYMSPIKLFEYGAMGKAVIAPATAAVREVMTHGEDGLLIEPGSRPELVSAIHYLACRAEERQRLGAAFQRRVREQHTWDAVAGRVTQLLEQSLVGARRQALVRRQALGARR